MVTVTVGELKTQEKEFPKLMISEKGIIILATSIRDEGYIIGTVVNKNNNYNFGYHSTGWHLDVFVELKGTITIQNS